MSHEVLRSCQCEAFFALCFPVSCTHDRVSFRKLDKGGQNHSYEKNGGGGEGVRATARLLGGSGGMFPQKIFEFYTL